MAAGLTVQFEAGRLECFERGGVSQREGIAVLCLTRKIGERIVIGEEIELVVVSVKNGAVRIGVKAPADMKIRREELWDREDDRRAA